MTPNLATKKKNGLHFLTWASFTEAPAKTESNAFQTSFRHVTFSSACYILFQTCVFLSGSADLLHVEPKDSDNNLTFHFLELLPDIIIQDNRKAPHIHFMNVNL